MCLEVPKFAKEKFKIKNAIRWTNVQKTLCCLKLTTMTFENGMLRISAAIWHWMHYHSALPYRNNRGKWQNLKQKKISIGKKRISKNISLLFLEVNVNVRKRTSLQALWNMLQPLKHWRKVVLSSINIKKWFLNLIRGMTVIFSNNFIQWDIIRTCWKWKQVVIYTGKLILNSWLIISLA